MAVSREMYQIWLMNADGTDPIQIVRSGITFTDYLPAWSPNGELIMFNQRCATKFCTPYLMSISSTDRTVLQGKRLEINIITIENVDYSPDGVFLAYEGGESGENYDIFYMDVTGANRKRVTTDPSPDFDPAWRPVQTSP